MSNRATTIPPETSPAITPNPAYARLASDEQIERAARALGLNGISVHVAASGEEAKRKLAEVIPAGAEVLTGASTTLIQLGLLGEIDSPTGRYNSVRANKLSRMDQKTQSREMQKLGATPEYIVGSVHAVTETGSVLVASMTGSQLGP
jgi:hypothetical protein